MRELDASLLLLALSLIALPTLSQSIYSDPVSENDQTLIFSTDDKYGNEIMVFDRVDDIRSYTSQALFSESASRLNRPLTKEELREIIRAPLGFESFNSLYFTPMKEGPTVNMFYTYGKLDEGQITNFFKPGDFNDVQINQYGVALQYAYSMYKKDKSSQDNNNLITFENFFIRGEYARTRNHGVIEFLPDNNERVDEFGINSVLLFNLNNQTLALFPNFTYLNIDQDIDNPYTRWRNIFSISFSYGTSPMYDQYQEYNSTLLATGGNPQPTWTLESLVLGRYDPRGKLLYGGVTYDQETFGNNHIVRQDYYLGASLANWSPSIKSINGFDIVVQPTIFTSNAENDSSQDNAQFRTELLMYYQPTDDLLFTFPLRYDKAINGPDNYENWRVGAQLTKQLSSLKKNNFGSNNPELFLTLRYDFQRFINLDKDLNLFLVDLVVTFR